VESDPRCRAHVYRNLDAPNTLLGLSFPAEWSGVLAAGWAGATLGAPNLGAAAGIGIYLLLRIVGHGRPEGHIHHWLLWRARRMRTGGTVSAAARARSPRFPFGQRERRDGGSAR